MNTLNLRRRSASALLCLTALAAITGSIQAGTALAADSDYEVRSVKVSFADLNLGTPAGVETLYKRIQHAARFVCTPSVEQRIRPMWKSCSDTAIADAVRKVNSPLLSALHSSKHGGFRVASATPTAALK